MKGIISYLAFILGMSGLILNFLIENSEEKIAILLSKTGLLHFWGVYLSLPVVIHIILFLFGLYIWVSERIKKEVKLNDDNREPYSTDSSFSLNYLWILFVAILFLTNPKEYQHKERVKEELNVVLKEIAKDNILYNEGIFQFFKPLVSGYANSMIDEFVIVDNYYLFSLTRSAEENSKGKIIGIGILNEVFLFFDSSDFSNNN